MIISVGLIKPHHFQPITSITLNNHNNRLFGVTFTIRYNDDDNDNEMIMMAMMTMMMIMAMMV